MMHDHEKRLLRVLDYIYDHPSADLSLDTLADVAAMSRFHWHRVYRALTGEPLAATVRRYRMHRASHDLVMTDRSIDAIARSVGSANLTSFRRVFADQFGMTPAQFRKSGALRPFKRQHNKEMTPMFPVEIRTETSIQLAALPHAGAYHEISRAFQKLSAVMASRDLFGQAGRMIAVYYDDPQAVAVDQLRSHAGFEMTRAVTLAAPLEALDLPAGRQAVLRYRGPYAGLPSVYDQLFGIWLPGSGEEPADSPSFEVYLNTPMDTLPEDLITELHLPLK